MIEICNLRNNKIEFEYDIRVDRSNKILGNKFYMHNELERDIVCEKYRMWFKEQLCIVRNKDFINELKRIYAIYKKYGKLRLFCWCYPKTCHSETIKEFFEWYDSTGYNINDIKGGE